MTNPRARRALASLGVVAFLAFYVWAVLEVHALLPKSFWTDLIYYPIAGLAWGVPVLGLITWAEKGGGR